MDELEFGGVIHDDTPEDLWMGADIEIPNPRHKWVDFKFQYQQTEVDNFSCTLSAAMLSLSANRGIPFTLAERKEVFETAIPKGFQLGKGWITNIAVDHVRRWWNARNPNDQVSTYGFKIGSPEFNEYTEKGYLFQISLKGNKAFNLDRNDGELSGTSFGEATYGHSECLNGHTDGKDLAVDSYPNSRPKSNLYTVPRANEPELIKNKVFYPMSYIFVFKNDMNKFANVPPWALDEVKQLESLGAVFNYATINDQIPGTETMGDMFQKVGVFTKGGPLTAARCAVIASKILKP